MRPSRTRLASVAAALLFAPPASTQAADDRPDEMRATHDSLEHVWRRFDAADFAGAAELLRPWCDRHPDDANGWLALGYCDAVGGSWSEAVTALTCARRDRATEVGAHASFDLARVLFEKARATALPGMPGEGRPAATEVADVRTRLSLVRLELETASDVLVDLIAAAPADLDARRGLAAVTGLLRDVVARDQAWRKKAAPPNETMQGQGTATPGPLKPGPSGAKASAGAPGQRGGQSGSGAKGTAPGPSANGGTSAIERSPLRPDEEVALGDALREALAERRRADERRADARARLRGTQN